MALIGYKISDRLMENETDLEKAESAKEQKRQVDIFIDYKLG